MSTPEAGISVAVLDVRVEVHHGGSWPELVAVTKQRCDPATRDYVARRVAAGKTDREAIRCVKRYLARRVWRLLDHPPIST